MKSTIVCLFLALVPLSCSVSASPCKFGLTLGGEYLSGVGASHTHSTHPEDAKFLRGDAGETEIDSVGFAAVALRYQNEMTAKWVFGAEIGGLIGKSTDTQQNDNDPRPASRGSFIYSEANGGLFAGVDLTYRPEPTGLYFGLVAQVTGVFVEHGWYRWGSHESASSETKWLPMAGPVIGYAISEDASVRLSALAGAAFGANLSVVWTF